LNLLFQFDIVNTGSFIRPLLSLSLSVMIILTLSILSRLCQEVQSARR
jgi:hypothetical protein